MVNDTQGKIKVEKTLPPRIDTSGREAKLLCSPSSSKIIISIGAIKRKFSGLSRKLNTERKSLKSSNLGGLANRNTSKKGCLTNPFISDIKDNVNY